MTIYLFDNNGSVKAPFKNTNKVKRTAVEWLEEELKGVYESDYFNKLLVKAKEMEKQQIIDACEFGKAFGLNQAWGYYNPIVNPEQYYNQNFKNTNK